MLPALSLQNTHLVNDRTLSFSIRMFDGAAIFNGMVDPTGRMIYQHLMIRTEGLKYETVPVF